VQLGALLLGRICPNSGLRPDLPRQISSGLNDFSLRPAAKRSQPYADPDAERLTVRSASGQVSRGVIMDRDRYWSMPAGALGMDQPTRSSTTLHWRGVRLRAALLSLLMLVAGAAVAVTTPGVAHAATLPTGFQESVAFGGLSNPTVVRFSSDGRIFVAEKRGVIKVFDSLSDSTPEIFADLNVNVYNFWDRGLLGMALDPDFPTNPYVYVLYTYDHELGTRTPMGHLGGRLRSVPNPSGSDRGWLCCQRPPIAAAGQRQHHDRCREGSGRRLVPAISQPLHRHSGIRSRWCPVRKRRRWRELQLRGLGARRSTAEPVR